MTDAVAHPASHPIASMASHAGPASRRIVAGYGFWIFLLSDFIIFASLFATFGVLVHNTDGGPDTHALFDLHTVAVETGALLLSSYACGMASLAAERRHLLAFQIAMLITALLGLVFLGLETREFVDLAGHGASPQRSAFLSSFFALVGCHGLHVALGELWLFTMMAQALAKGLRDDIQRRVLCFSLFWHALDIIWVGIFTAVYLYGVYL